jgi:hypothetical protein
MKGGDAAMKRNLSKNRMLLALRICVAIGLTVVQGYRCLAQNCEATEGGVGRAAKVTHIL